jgi:hypothetical protein
LTFFKSFTKRNHDSISIWRDAITQGNLLVGDDSGHGMLFTTFDNRLMLILHSPFKMPLSRGRIFEMEDTGDTLKVIRECRELYGAASGE